MHEQELKKKDPEKLKWKNMLQTQRRYCGRLALLRSKPLRAKDRVEKYSVQQQP